MIKINNLVAEIFPRLDNRSISVIESENRVTGHTTAKLISFLGRVLSNPNKVYKFLEDDPRPSRAKYHDWKMFKGMCQDLNLKCMIFKETDMTVEFKLYSYYENKYDLLNGREK